MTEMAILTLLNDVLRLNIWIEYERQLLA